MINQQDLSKIPLDKLDVLIKEAKNEKRARMRHLKETEQLEGMQVSFEVDYPPADANNPPLHLQIIKKLYSPTSGWEYFMRYWAEDCESSYVAGSPFSEGRHRYDAEIIPVRSFGLELPDSEFHEWVFARRKRREELTGGVERRLFLLNKLQKILLGRGYRPLEAEAVLFFASSPCILPGLSLSFCGSHWITKHDVLISEVTQRGNRWVLHLRDSLSLITPRPKDCVIAVKMR